MRDDNDDDERRGSIWARPEMTVTFRAEIMPGVSREERTFRIERVLPNERVTLHNFAGEFRETSFEAINFLRSEPPAVAGG